MKQKKKSRKVPAEATDDQPEQPDTDEAAAGEDAPPAAPAEADRTDDPGSAEGPAEVEQLRDRLLRLQADFDNYRKRVQREKNELYRRANEDIMMELLPVLDHLDIALEAAETHDAPDAFVEGFRLVSEQLVAALGKFGLKPVDAEGEAFDVNLHEAVSHLPSPDVPEEHVMNQVRRGYKLSDFLLRPAQVVVSSGPPGDSATQADTNEQAEE